MQLSQSVQVSGFSLFGPDPIGSLHIPVDPFTDLTLYGLNGSGKTRVMEAMRHCLSGVATPSRAFAHLTFTDEWLGWSTNLIKNLSLSVDLLSGRIPDLDDWILDSGSHEEENAQWSARITRFRNDLAALGGDLDLRADAVGLTIEASGTWAAPSWRTYLSTTAAPNQSGFELLDPLRDLAERAAEPALAEGAILALEAELNLSPTAQWAIADLQLHNCRSKTVRPDWVPVRVAKLLDTQIGNGYISIVHAGRSVDDISDSTQHLIRAQSPDPNLWPSKHQSAVIDQLSNDASRYASALFGIDAQLALRVLETNGAKRGRLDWFWTDPRGAEVPLKETSSGEQLISGTAISLALDLEGKDVTAIIFFDEPERSLHPQAVERIARGRSELSMEDNIQNTALYSLVFATHAPALVEPARGDVVHIDRHPDGEVRANRLQFDQWSEPKQVAASLGWGTSDVLQKINRWLVVEGHHDIVILGTLFGEELIKRGWALAPMRGAQQVSTALTSRFILDYTDANIRLVLDNIDAALVAEFDEAKALYLDGNQKAARKRLDAMNTGRSTEADHLSSAALEAIGRGTLHRIEVVGLAKPDILDYLNPVDLGLTSSWEELDRVFKAGNRGQKFSGTQRKDWLRSQGMKTNDARLRSAALKLDDLADLATVLS